MKVTIRYLAEFQRLAKDLKRKYKSFKDDYDTFLDELERNPFGGRASWASHIQESNGYCFVAGTIFLRRSLLA